MGKPGAGSSYAAIACDSDCRYLKDVEKGPDYSYYKYPLEPLFGRILSPFEQFLKRTTAGGITLMGATVVALILANSGLGGVFHKLWELPLRIGIGPLQLDLSLHRWINDALMALFFLLVGLELKREVLVGELSSLRDAALPVIAAAGGMIFPAAIYLSINAGSPDSRGWGVPMATDIAFSIGILVMLAWRIPRNLIIFLAALAIADDLGAVIVIAFFYTNELSLEALGIAALLMGGLVLLNQGGIRRSLPYALLGAALWLALVKSGIHATIAGVLLALTIPARPVYSPAAFEKRLHQLHNAFHSETIDPSTDDRPLSNPRMARIAGGVESAAKAVQSPLQRMEHVLSRWVTFTVIPLFALSNVGIDFSTIQAEHIFTQRVTLGVILGLVFGKFLGVISFCLLAVKLRISRLPNGVAWRHMLGVSWLAGIGFTMSLFISQLAFLHPVKIEEAKLGILVGSAVSACIGLIWLFLVGRKNPPEGV